MFDFETVCFDIIGCSITMLLILICKALQPIQRSPGRQVKKSYLQNLYLMLMMQYVMSLRLQTVFSIDT